MNHRPKITANSAHTPEGIAMHKMESLEFYRLLNKDSLSGALLIFIKGWKNLGESKQGEFMAKS